jgi:prepilin peptidase CpaA
MHTTTAPPSLDATTPPVGSLASLPPSLLPSLLIAAVLAAALFVAQRATGSSLPAFPAGAAFLVLIAQQDVRRRKIPNWATGSALVLALAYHAWTGGGQGALLSLAGAAVPFVLLLAVYAARIVGAGDVKAFMVVGAFWGLPVAFSVIAWTALIAGVLALIFVTTNGEVGAFFRRWWLLMVSWATRSRGELEVPERGPILGAALPLGVAIGFAVVAHLHWGGPWS